MDGIALDARLTYGATETTPVFLTKDRYSVVDTGDPAAAGLRYRRDDRGP